MNDDDNDYDDDDVAWRAVVLYDFVYEHNGILYKKNSKITNQVYILTEEKKIESVDVLSTSSLNLLILPRLIFKVHSRRSSWEEEEMTVMKI